MVNTSVSFVIISFTANEKLSIKNKLRYHKGLSLERKDKFIEGVLKE